jgi:hypothetical protein
LLEAFKKMESKNELLMSEKDYERRKNEKLTKELEDL